MVSQPGSFPSSSAVRRRPRRSRGARDRPCAGEQRGAQSDGARHRRGGVGSVRGVPAAPPGMKPKRLVLLDTNESGLFELAEELRAAAPLDLREALVSIVDRDQLVRVFADERPDIVFHAAAYKHVPMLESHPTQAVLTNVVGT